MPRPPPPQPIWLGPRPCGTAAAAMPPPIHLFPDPPPGGRLLPGACRRADASSQAPRDSDGHIILRAVECPFLWWAASGDSAYESGDYGWYCLACDQWATEGHLHSRAHKRHWYQGGMATDPVRPPGSTTYWSTDNFPGWKLRHTDEPYTLARDWDQTPANANGSSVWRSCHSGKLSVLQYVVLPGGRTGSVAIPP